MTRPGAERPGEVITMAGVYAPQHDSELLTDVMTQTGLAKGRRVADLCTGSGFVAVNAAVQGAAHVMAFDVSARAVRCSCANAAALDVDVDVRHGPWTRAREFAPFDVVLCNPPYVPQPPFPDPHAIPQYVGPAAAFDGGLDGRLVLDPLCTSASDLLSDEGTLLLVHSEFADVDASLHILRDSGLKASVIARRWVPFGPVLKARVAWLEQTGRIERGCRIEELVVIRADVP